MGSRNMRNAGGGQGDVDLAMAGWEQLSKSPDKMAEVMASLKDPEVMAKAQEITQEIKGPSSLAESLPEPAQGAALHPEVRPRPLSPRGRYAVCLRAPSTARSPPLSAQEMLKDPMYMAAAKAKLGDLQVRGLGGAVGCSCRCWAGVGQ